MVSNAPNIKRQNRPTGDWGKSRVAYYEGESVAPRTRQIKLRNITANTSFTLPANVRIHGEIAVFNNSGVAQAAITIGTASGGTQVAAGAVVAANTTAIQAATDTGVLRTDRTIFLNSAAWQAGTHVVLNASEYPPSSNTNALS